MNKSNILYLIFRALEASKYFINLGIDVRQKDKINQTPIYYAAREKKIELCKYLISLGSEVNNPDIYSQTPIYYGAREGATDVCELLIINGADVNLEDKYGQTCIFYSIKNGHLETTEFLIKSGADVNKIDKKKMTPYLYSLKNNKPEIAELLVKYNANTDNITKKKESKKKIDDAKTENTKNPFEKYVLVKMDGSNGKCRLSEEELSKFENDFKEIFNILNNKNELELIENNADSRLQGTEGWEKVCKRILNHLWKMKEAEIFHRPVDVIALNIPDYPMIIKKPMDFGTIKKKLTNGMYVNFIEFDEDINLVFNNCFLYNGVRNFK